MSTKPETKIVNKIQVWVDDHGGKCVKYHGDTMGELGQPDLMIGLIVKHGITHKLIHAMIEVKTPTGKTSDMQRLRLKEWAAQGFITGSVTSVADLQELIRQNINTAPLWRGYATLKGNVYRVET